MKKGILSTIIVIQIVLLLLLALSQLQYEKENFSTQQQFERISAYKMSSSYENIRHNVETIRKLNSTEETFNTYINYVGNTYSRIYFIEIDINETHLRLTDYDFEMHKEGLI